MRDGKITHELSKEELDAASLSDKYDKPPWTESTEDTFALYRLTSKGSNLHNIQ